MNRRGQVFMVYVMIFMAVALMAFALIEPFKEILNQDSVRGGGGLNCLGTPTFNQTAFDQQNEFDRLVYRPTCFVTGMGVVWFVGVIVIGAFWWLLGKLKK